PTVVLGGDTPVRATVVGVVDDRNTYGVSAWVLPGDVERWITPDPAYGPAQLGMQVWVPPADADALTQTLQTELVASVPGGNVSVGRYDSGEELGVVNLVLAYGVRAIGVFALVLGGIGVLNVGLVTVRQRIREIGVRRSFGATSGRVFFSVLLESVCATAVAGGLAVLLSVAIIANLPLSLILPSEISLTDVPPYPYEAALEGFLAATAIGALAGVVPAVMAVRAQVIDAIRY
ncbi:FtsX-like permease family protein, partial [Kineococcus sp. R8]|uniref:ABC transporter permease n=1 Tax=Kineococcus siccus TaxID=2696567 RepID=UPI0014127D2A